MKDIEATKGEIVMYQPDETIRLEVRVEDETVWLNRQQIAEPHRNSFRRHLRQFELLF